MSKFRMILFQKVQSPGCPNFGRSKLQKVSIPDGPNSVISWFRNTQFPESPNSRKSKFQKVQIPEGPNSGRPKFRKVQIPEGPNIGRSKFWMILDSHSVSNSSLTIQNRKFQVPSLVSRLVPALPNPHTSQVRWSGRHSGVINTNVCRLSLSN